MLAYVLLLAAATAVAGIEGESPDQKSCPNGVLVPIAKPCREATESPSIEEPPFSITTTTPVPMTPPPLRRYPKPRNNPGDWVTTNDYPARSLRDEEDGVTGFRVEISADGRVSSCMVISSSGSAALDAATCSNVTRRARFEPALDYGGNPIISYYSNRVSWRIPADPSYALQSIFSPSGPQAVFGTYTEIPESDYPLEALEKGWRGRVQIVLTISSEGSVTACAVQTGTGHELLDNKACELASKWIFLPARDPAGGTIAGTTTHEFGWNLPDAWRVYKRTGLYPKKPVE